MKKILSLVLALIIAISMFAGSVSAIDFDDEVAYTGAYKPVVVDFTGGVITVTQDYFIGTLNAPVVKQNVKVIDGTSGSDFVAFVEHIELGEPNGAPEDFSTYAAMNPGLKSDEYGKIYMYDYLVDPLGESEKEQKDIEKFADYVAEILSTRASDIGNLDEDDVAEFIKLWKEAYSTGVSSDDTTVRYDAETQLRANKRAIKDIVDANGNLKPGIYDAGDVANYNVVALLYDVYDATGYEATSYLVYLNAEYERIVTNISKSLVVFDKDTVFANSTFTVTFTQPKSVVASTLALNLKFDKEAFEIVEIAEVPFASVQPDVNNCNTKGNVSISWMDSTSDANTEIAKDTVLLQATFKVKDTAPLGDKTFEIAEYNVTGNFNEETFDFEDITPDIGELTKTIGVVEVPTYTILGNVKSFGDASKNMTVEILSNGTVVDTKTITDNSGIYAFNKLSNGEYTIRVSKTKHASREYEITVDGENVTQDVEIWLYGDTNADGNVNSVDLLQISRKIANLSSMFNQAANQDYRFKVANLTKLTMGDDTINSADLLQISRKVANLSSIFDRIV